MRIAVPVVLSVALLVVGCSRSDPNAPTRVPVRGTVTLDSKPLSGVIVSFVPIGATLGNGGGAYADKSGTYELIDPRGKKGDRPANIA